jgi:hypothetical protein
MKRTETVFSWPTSVCLAVLVLLFPGSIQNALAQTCGYWMHPQYSTYSNASTDGTYVYTSVTLSGTTTGACPYSCGSECYATHTPEAYNTIGSTGGWQVGSAQPWNHYLNVVNNKQIAASAGSYWFISQGEVICSIAGVIYLNSASLPVKIGTQQVQFYWDTTQNPNYDCYYANNCNYAPAGSYCGPAFFTTAFNKGAAPYCYIYDSRKYFFIKIGSSLNSWQTGQNNYFSDNISTYPCDAPIP